MNIKIEDWGMVPIKEALEEQDRYWERRTRGKIPDTTIFAEHEPVYTAGASLKNNPQGKQKCFKVDIAELLAPIIDTRRGGLVTYQGPGILSVYCVFGIKNQSPVELAGILEDAAIAFLKTYGIKPERSKRNRGCFIRENKKIASIGLQISRGITRYGLAISLDPDPQYLEPLIPCGLNGIELTSLAQELGLKKFSEKDKDIIKTTLSTEIVRRWLELKQYKNPRDCGFLIANFLRAALCA